MIRRPRRRAALRSARPLVELLESREALTSLAGPPASFLPGPVPLSSLPTIDGRSIVRAPAAVEAATSAVRIVAVVNPASPVETAKPTQAPPATNPPVVRTDLFGVVGPAVVAGDLEFSGDVPTLDYRSSTPAPVPLPCADHRWAEPSRVLAAGWALEAPVVQRERMPAPPVLAAAPASAPRATPPRAASAALPVLTGVLGIAALVALHFENRRRPRLAV